MPFFYPRHSDPIRPSPLFEELQAHGHQWQAAELHQEVQKPRTIREAMCFRCGTRADGG